MVMSGLGVTTRVMKTLNHIIKPQSSPNERTKQATKYENRIQIQIIGKYLKLGLPKKLQKFQ
jgi:hypothetical protein